MSVVTLLALGAGLVLDGVTLACNESMPPQCLGFHVPWPALICVAFATILFAGAARRLDARSHLRWAVLLSTLALVGGITSWILALRTASVIG